MRKTTFSKDSPRLILASFTRRRKHKDLTVGLGLRFMLSPHLALRTEYERFEMDNTEIDNPSLNVQFNYQKIYALTT